MTMTTMTQQECQAKIETLISHGPFTNEQICVALKMPIGSRTVDKALQALKRTGKVRFHPEIRAWVPVGQKTCPTCAGKGWVP